MPKGIPGSKANCYVDGCDTPNSSYGLCSRHWRRLQKYGDPTAGPPKSLPWPENLLARLNDEPTGCVTYTGHRNPLGYGKVRRNGRSEYAHRASYELFVGPIPDGWQVDHLCRNPSCVNPVHLEAVTPRENTRRAFDTPTCGNGHLWDEGNAYVRPDGTGRNCRACARERKQATQTRELYARMSEAKDRVAPQDDAVRTR